MTTTTTDITSPKSAFVDSNGWFTEYAKDYRNTISVRFRTGNEIHIGWANSSQTKCGRWLRNVGLSHRVFRSVTCENCSPTGGAA